MEHVVSSNMNKNGADSNITLKKKKKHVTDLGKYADPCGSCHAFSGLAWLRLCVYVPSPFSSLSGLAVSGATLVPLKVPIPDTPWDWHRTAVPRPLWHPLAVSRQTVLAVPVFGLASNASRSPSVGLSLPPSPALAATRWMTSGKAVVPGRLGRAEAGLGSFE